MRSAAPLTLFKNPRVGTTIGVGPWANCGPPSEMVVVAPFAHGRVNPCKASAPAKTQSQFHARQYSHSDELQCGFPSNRRLRCDADSLETQPTQTASRGNFLVFGQNGWPLQLVEMIGEQHGGRSSHHAGWGRIGLRHRAALPDGNAAQSAPPRSSRSMGTEKKRSGNRVWPVFTRSGRSGVDRPDRRRSRRAGSPRRSSRPPAAGLG